MDVKCCKCKKGYDLASNIFEYEKDTNCPILICPHCNFKHAINFMLFDNKIENLKKAEKINLTTNYPILGASRIADASRVDQSRVDDGDVKAGVVWDVNALKYDNISFDVSTEDINPIALYFKPDGTKMYLIGTDIDAVLQYSLSIAWNIATASYDNKSFGVSTEDTDPYGLYFKPDGTKMYIMGYYNKKIFQYSLSAAWDITSASYDNKSFDVSIEERNPYGLYFKPDGTKMYVVGIFRDLVRQYSLSAAWDITSASYDDKSFDVSPQDGAPIDIDFKPDGTKMSIMGYYNKKIFQYSLSAAWDITSASYDNKSFGVSTEDINPIGLSLKPDGTKMYLLGVENASIFQYSLVSDWTKTDDFILATRIYGSKGPYARAYKLRWRDVTDGGVFADVLATGEITYSAVTDLTDGGDLLLEEKICGAQSGYSWQNGLESEGDNLLPDTDTYSLADEYYTEFQWALDCNDAEDEHEYEFELWDVTEGVSIGTCLASITMAITIVGGLSMKWNGRTISKWNGAVIDKLNEID